MGVVARTADFDMPLGDVRVSATRGERALLRWTRRRGPGVRDWDADHLPVSLRARAARGCSLMGGRFLPTFHCIGMERKLLRILTVRPPG